MAKVNKDIQEYTYQNDKEGSDMSRTKILVAMSPNLLKEIDQVRADWLISDRSDAIEDAARDWIKKKKEEAMVLKNHKTSSDGAIQDQDKPSESKDIKTFETINGHKERRSHNLVLGDPNSSVTSEEGSITCDGFHFNGAQRELQLLGDLK